MKIDTTARLVIQSCLKADDAYGGRAYLRALRNGTSKLQILYELSMSDDCRRVGGEIPGLIDACANEGIGETNDKSFAAPPAHTTHVTRGTIAGT